MSKTIKLTQRISLGMSVVLFLSFSPLPITGDNSRSVPQASVSEQKIIHSSEETKEVKESNTSDVSSRIVVKLSPEAAPQEIAQKVKGEILRQGPLNYMTLTFEASKVEEVLKELQRTEGVLSAEPSQKVSTSQVTVKEPYYSEQWGLAKAELPKAWDLGASGEGVTVAIVDTGVDISHPDLRDNLLPGYNAITGEKGLSVVQDNNGHGTHVAGIIAASLNGKGVVGVAYKAKLLPIKAMDRSGEGTDDTIADGIIWAADQGAKIINLSLGSNTETQVLKDALQYAKNKGCLVIAAAGNVVSGQGVDHLAYPATDPDVLAVTATDKQDQIASFSLRGSQVALSAPGVDILSDYWQNRSGYASSDGTSMASPFVAGVAALVWGEHPELTAEEIKVILKDSAQDLGDPGRDSEYGYGRVDAYWALRFAEGGKTSNSPAKLDWAGGEVEGVGEEARATLKVPPKALSPKPDKEVTVQVKAASDVADLPPEIIPLGEAFSIEWEGEAQKLLTLTLDLSVPLPKGDNSLGILYRWSGTRWISIRGGTNSASITAGITEPGLYRVGFAPRPEGDRIAGVDRIQTALEISRATFATGADTVILARADDFPDALAGATLAYKFHAPILLTEVKELPDSVLSELQRLKPKNLLLLGGTGAISSEVEAKLRELGEVKRLGGTNRYATAAQIAEELGTLGEAILVSGENFPDAISSGALAAEKGVPILLTQSESLPPETEEALRKHQVSKTIVIGGVGVISAKQVENYPSPVRLAGLDRYETALAVLKAYPPKGSFLYLATGEDFPDALTGGVMAVLQGTRILLLPPTGLSVKAQDILQGWKGISPLALGGKNVIPTEVLTQVKEMLH